MKTQFLITQISTFVMFSILMFGSEDCISQKIITFKDGKEIKAFITYQANDTVKYYLESQPQIVYVETMDHIEKISSLNKEPVFASDNDAGIYYYKKYKHYRKETINGAIFFSVGTVLDIFGISGLSSLSGKDKPADNLAKIPFTVCTVVGSVGIISGIILLTDGAANMKKYKEKMNGVSFEITYTPHLKGFSFIYRF